MKLFVAFLVVCLLGSSALANSICFELFANNSSFSQLATKLAQDNDNNSITQKQKKLIAQVREKGFNFQWAEDFMTDAFIAKIFSPAHGHKEWLNFRIFKLFVYSRLMNLYRRGQEFKDENLIRIFIYYQGQPQMLANDLDMRILIAAAKINKFPLGDGDGTFFQKVVAWANKTANGQSSYLNNNSSEITIPLKQTLEKFEDEIKNLL